MSRILSVQDLSCVGKCSLSVALPVLSVMGHACSVLPTAVLSTHTGFSNPETVNLEEKMLPFARHWQGQGISFNAVSCGYLASPGQAERVEEILAMFSCPLILDPVLGDGGSFYSRMTPAHGQALKRLFPYARVVLPNVTEAALLTGLPYREAGDEAYWASLAEGLLGLGAENVVITGISRDGGDLGWYAADGRAARLETAPRIPGSCHGTGDLFSAVFAGAFLRGASVSAAAALAAAFVRRCLEATPAPTPLGVCFETVLPWLARQAEALPDFSDCNG